MQLRSTPSIDSRAAVAHAVWSARQAARADAYAVIGALLLAPAPQALLDALGYCPPPLRHDDFVRDWQALAQQARDASVSEVAREHEALFIAVGTPAVDPRASVYRGGGALAALRDELCALGLERRGDAVWPEDHLGALCEVMRLLLQDPARPAAPQAFFRRHIAPWHAACLADLRRVDGAPFHAALAALAQTFFELEAQEADDDATP